MNSNNVFSKIKLNVNHVYMAIIVVCCTRKTKRYIIKYTHVTLYSFSEYKETIHFVKQLILGNCCIDSNRFHIIIIF